MKVVWAALAEQRALEAVDYIAQDRPQAAAAWLEELMERVGALDRLALRGRVVPCGTGGVLGIRPTWPKAHNTR